mmetsp:Transcript_8358/g.21998  ORF Transcript_8358/g.21998 Transcript_8358/m.21998 type:complete len:250 (-) Transcript_8358:3395-4144(-)
MSSPFINPELRGSRLLVRLRRSLIRSNPTQRENARKMKLNTVGDERLVPDGPVFWGMIKKIVHLVDIRRVPVEDLQKFNHKQRIILNQRRIEANWIRRTVKREEKLLASDKAAVAKYNEYLGSKGLQDAAIERAVSEEREAGKLWSVSDGVKSSYRIPVKDINKYTFRERLLLTRYYRHKEYMEQRRLKCEEDDAKGMEHGITPDGDSSSDVEAHSRVESERETHSIAVDSVSQRKGEDTAHSKPETTS